MCRIAPVYFHYVTLSDTIIGYMYNCCFPLWRVCYLLAQITYRSLQYPIDNTADAMFRKRVRNFKLSFPSDFETLPYTDAQLCVIMF